MKVRFIRSIPPRVNRAQWRWFARFRVTPRPPAQVHRRSLNRYAVAKSEYFGPTVTPWHARALELFANGFDTDSARLIALNEYRLSLEQQWRLDADERPVSPPVRMVGAERNG
jgi:hypothetical protein